MLRLFVQELAEYMSEIRQKKVTFDTNKLVLTAGATSANETLMFCLAEPGEAFLIPTPYYPGCVKTFSIFRFLYFSSYQRKLNH